jgi:heme/copper-type cytochrome/quinol oxidase subunit 2
VIRCALMLLLLALAAVAAELTFVLPIENGRVPEALRRIRVHQNDAVTLKWSSDRPITIHLHGYDIEKQVRPGTITEMTFTARATGRFTVETHEASGGHHGPPLVTLEVYP